MCREEFRLTRETINAPANAIGYQYDFVANRLARTSAGTRGVPAASYGYDANDRLNGDTYDGNGNTVTSGNTTDSYDAENRLIHRCVGDPLFPTTTFDIPYDGDGNRMQKVELDSILGQITTVYVVDDRNPTGYAQVLEELVTVNGGATSTRYYTYGHVLISQREAVSGTHFYNQDGHGNVRFLTDTTATISDTYTYDAFGILIAQTHVGTPTPNNYLYSGEQLDGDLGLYYNRARYLNQNSGRFWTMDSFDGHDEDTLSLHKYAHVRDDAPDKVDPTGHWPSKLFWHVHQKVIDTMLDFLPPHDLEILKMADSHIDDKPFQSSYYSYVHAMSSPVHNRPEAKRMANNWVRSELVFARTLEADGKHDLAMEHLGYAMHTLQDSTSPAHADFQYWDGTWSDFSKTVREHVDKELYDPEIGSELYSITLKTYIYVKYSRSLPADFFPPLSVPLPLISHADLGYVKAGEGVEYFDFVGFVDQW